MKIIEWIRPLREVSLAGKHVRLYMGNEAGDLDSGKNDSFMTHFTIYCMNITVNFSCEGNFKLFWVKFGIKCIPLRVNIDFNLFKNSLLCSGNVLLQPVCRSWNYPFAPFQLSSKPFQPKDWSPIRSRFIWYQVRFWQSGEPYRSGNSTDLVEILMKGSRFILSARWSWEYKKSSSKTGIGFGWSQ